MTKTIVIVLGLLLIGGGYYFLSAKQPQPKADRPLDEITEPIVPAETSTVTLNSTGFDPQTLTIKSGSQVNWVNRSGKMGNVSSDPHPIHSNYKPLNLGNFADGDSVSMTFSTPGTYTYHNHLNSTHTGTIIVE